MPKTPPGSPYLSPSTRPISIQDFQKVLVNLIKTAGNSSESFDMFGPSEQATSAKSDNPRLRASKLEFKAVDEV
jgi:hypothetical protein